MVHACKETNFQDEELAKNQKEHSEKQSTTLEVKGSNRLKLGKHTGWHNGRDHGCPAPAERVFRGSRH